MFRGVTRMGMSMRELKEGERKKRKGGECQEPKVRKTGTRQSVVSPPGKGDFLEVVPEH